MKRTGSLTVILAMMATGNRKARHMRPALEQASISIDRTIGNDDFRAYGKYSEGHGFDIDVLKNGKRVAMRNAAWPTHGEGCRDTALVSDTLEAVSTGKAVGNTYFF